MSTQKKFKEVVDNFLSFIKGKRLVIHNAEFDLSHLNNELKIIGRDTIKNEVVDTLVVARDKFPGSQISLDSLCKKYRIDNSKRIKHTALIDCELLSKVYINLLDQKEPILDFKSPDTSTPNTIDKNVIYFKKIIRPSEERKKIMKFLKNNKENFLIKSLIIKLFEIFSNFTSESEL